MSEVHKAISAHSSKQHEHIKAFMRLENMRELAIEEAVSKCKTMSLLLQMRLMKLPSRSISSPKRDRTDKTPCINGNGQRIRKPYVKLDDPVASESPAGSIYYVYPT